MMCAGGCPALPVDERAGLSRELGLPLAGIQLPYGEILFVQEVVTHFIYYIKWVTTSWTNS